MRSLAHVFVSLATLMTLAGCGSGAGRATGPIPLTSLADALAEEFCRGLYRCCEASERSIEGTAAANEATCVSGLRDELSGGLVGNLQEDIDAGRTVYDADRARECVDNIASRSCRDWGVQYAFRDVPGCAQLAEGRLEPGRSCARDQQCAAGYCEVATCVALVADGQACTRTQGCEPGSYCGPNEPGIGGSRACIAIAPIDGTCADNDGCATYSCVIPAGGGPGVCTRPTTCNGLSPDH